MKKLNQKGFGAIGILLVVVVIAMVGAVGYFVWNSQKNGSAGSTKDWLTTNQIQSKTETLSQDVSNISAAAAQKNVAQMQTACNKLSTDVQDAQQIPAGPDEKLSKQFTDALTTLSSSSQNCVKAIESGDSNLLTTSGQEATKGVNQLADFVDAAKVHIN